MSLVKSGHDRKSSRRKWNAASLAMLQVSLMQRMLHLIVGSSISFLGYGLLGVRLRASLPAADSCSEHLWHFRPALNSSRRFAIRAPAKISRRDDDFRLP